MTTPALGESLGLTQHVLVLTTGIDDNRASGKEIRAAPVGIAVWPPHALSLPSGVTPSTPLPQQGQHRALHS